MENLNKLCGVCKRYVKTNNKDKRFICKECRKAIRKVCKIKIE